MTILYVYEGSRNPAFERAVQRDLRAFGATTQARSHSGENGVTTVTLELADDHRAADIVEWLRARDGVLDAVRESFGEQV